MRGRGQVAQRPELRNASSANGATINIDSGSVFFSCTHHSHTEYRNAPEIRADSVLYYNVWNSLGLMALPHFASIALIVTTISAIFGVDIM